MTSVPGNVLASEKKWDDWSDCEKHPRLPDASGRVGQVADFKKTNTDFSAHRNLGRVVVTA